MASLRDASETSAALCRVLTQTKELERKLADWDDLQNKIKQEVANTPNIVRLNVGGTIFEISKGILLREEGSYFHGLLGSGSWKRDGPANTYFLDMDPVLFRRVLVYLRTGTLMPSDGLTKPERDDLRDMMEYLKVCHWRVETQRIRWSARRKSQEIALSNDCRTVEKSTYQRWGGVIATEALEGTFQLRVEGAAVDFFVGLCLLAGFDSSSSETTSVHCYTYHSNGVVYKKKSAPELQAKIEPHDVVTIQRCALEVVFTVGDGAPVYVPLIDPHEELFPVVFMKWPAKVSVVDVMEQ